VATKVLEQLRQPVTLENQQIVPGGSIGISIYPDDGEAADLLIKCADIAMYQSKQGGRGRLQFYSSEFAEFTQQRFHLENKLRQAVEHNHFQVFYQPQIHSRQNKLIGAEALVRWIDPEKGVISPADFIPLAEETGLIEPIGHWVLRTACQQTKAWQEAGFEPFRISVNVADLQIASGSIIHSCREILNETQLAPEYLELEITEGFIMKNPENSISTLHELRDLGISLAIDDFGTGYSSLSYLKQLPIDRLKIDRSFVMDIPNDKDDEAITATIIAMTKNLGLAVIAEGVENERQIQFLDEHGCYELQGFYFSKPVDKDEFVKQLQQMKREPQAVE
jgi:EAL domain-containing protein (putative c-di-GMP-specific phosphodiesterase class I)